MSSAHGFVLLHEESVPEIDSHARLYRHTKSGASLLSLTNQDENKVFGITFRTPVTTANGLPHIMEHVVLAGSRKFPVKEPFIEMVKGSLNTFLNAMTFPDKTSYPVASTNLKDFYNLIDVYLDGVFHPLLTPQHLDYEGWHYDLETADDPLQYKGVVFNEMKGAYSSPDGLMGKYSREALFDPDHPYGVDSGGDPRVIPTLTYEAFKAFHETYYHPSNALIYFYGDDDPEERLRLLDRYLSEFEARPVASEIPVYPLRSEGRRAVLPYSVDPSEEPVENGRYYLTLNWLLPEIEDVKTGMGLSILSHILSGTVGSPLQRSLMESGLGEDTIGGGFSLTYTRQGTFTAGMKGIQKENLERVEALIIDTLTGLARGGIDPETVAASLNTVEFRLREANTGSYPRGLVYMFSILGRWLYDGDPLEGLRYEKPLAAVKDAAAAGGFFEGLIEEYLLQNPHRATVILEPNTTLAQEQRAEEERRLAETRARLSPAELEAIRANSLAIKKRQETPDDPADLAKLPTLSLDDLEPKVRTYPLARDGFQETEILFHDLFTNGIVYFRVGFNLRVLPQELLPYVPLFSYALTEIGTETEDYVKLSQRIGRHSGGIGASHYIADRHDAPEALAWLFLKGKATLAQTGEMLAIMRDVLLTVRLDNRERFRQMVLEEKAGEESGLIPGGHSVVIGRLKAMFSEAGWISEQMNGLDYLFFLRRLAAEVETNWPAVLSRLEEIRRRLIRRGHMICDITLDADNFNQIRPQIESFIAALPAGDETLQIWSPERRRRNEGFTMPAQVNYVGKGANIHELGFESHGSIHVISNMLRTGYLWEQVRMKGGAYGAFMPYNAYAGLIGFVSYRDPNLEKTLAVYDNTAAYLRSVPWTQENIEKAIIGVIGNMDSYQLPDAKGYTALIHYLHGITDDYRQARRDEVLSTGVADFLRFADVLDAIKKEGQIVVLGSAEKIGRAEKDFELTLTRVI